MFSWFKRKPQAAPKVRRSIFSTEMPQLPEGMVTVQDVIANLAAKRPVIYQVPGAQDDSTGIPTLKLPTGDTAPSDALTMWYASQGFIGWQLSALIAQHWLVNKVCSMPGKDAIRKGFNVAAVDGEEIDDDLVRLLNTYDRKFRLKHNLQQFVHFGRIFGIRIAIFLVDSTDLDYYEKPFNLDGVTPGSYKGIVQVDPYWCAPELSAVSASQPDTQHFYEPTWWVINGKRYHRSHLLIFRNCDIPDILKPSYLYGGVPVPQQIMERVYAAERTANEAPQLAMTKRSSVWLTDMEKFVAKGDAAITAMQQWIAYRDNYGIKIGDKEGDEFTQYDTSLADLDEVIMSQFQIVAAAGNVPATKLLGTTPKGFNATGEYEESSYHEELESIQANDLTPFVERHHALVQKSYGKQQSYVETTVVWRPLDSPTAKELAETNLAKAQTGQVLVESGAISSDEERQRIALDPDSGYHELGTRDELDEDAEE